MPVIGSYRYESQLASGRVGHVNTTPICGERHRRAPQSAAFRVVAHSASVTAKSIPGGTFMATCATCRGRGRCPRCDGSGRKSDHPDDLALWIMDTFVDEIGTVRDALGLDRFHLLGHSWGGWLALEYALAQPSGLESMVLASTSASVPAFAAETRRLKESLPAEVQRTIDEHEAAGTTDDEAYGEAAMAYYTRWICRLDPWPDHVMRSANNISEDMYATMQGPEWKVTGNLKDWDVTERLGELALPVLVTSGRYDEMSEAWSARWSPVSAALSGWCSRTVPTSRRSRSRTATAASSPPSSTASRRIPTDCPTRCHEPSRTLPPRKPTAERGRPMMPTSEILNGTMHKLRCRIPKGFAGTTPRATALGPLKAVPG